MGNAIDAAGSLQSLRAESLGIGASSADTPSADSSVELQPGRRAEYPHLAEALNCIPQPAAALHRSGEVSMMNASMRRFLGAGGPLALRKRLLCWSQTGEPLDRNRLRRWLQQNESTVKCPANLPEPGAPVTPGGVLRTKVRWLAAQASESLGSPGPEALLIVYPANPLVSISTAALRRNLGLTPAETCVTERLFAGRSLAEAAADLCISRETAKKHLASIFRKADVNSQAQLMVRIATGPHHEADLA